MLDEPLEGLAPIIVDSLLDAIQRLTRGQIAFAGPSAMLLAEPDRLASLIVAG